MREVDHRSSSHRSRHTSRSRSRDRDRERDRDRDRDRDYYSRRRRSKSRSRTSKSSKKSSKKSKKKRYRRSSSSSSASSSRSRGSIKSSGSSIRRTATRPPSSEENSSSIQAIKDINLHATEIPDKNALEKIDEDSFAAQPFFSSAESKKIPEKVIIDLKNDTISVEKQEDTQPEQSQIFHPNFLGDEMRKMEKWVKKLYNYRQKAFQE